MLASAASAMEEMVGVSLVDGDPAIRRSRQLMLISENFRVHSYATCAALLGDWRSRNDGCIVVDVHMPEFDGIDLLREMRATGWQGRGILLNGVITDDTILNDAKRFGDQVLDRYVADSRLLSAISAATVRFGET